MGVSPLFRLAWTHKSSTLNTGTKSKLDPVRRGGVFYVVENVALRKKKKKEGEVVVVVVKEKKKERSQGSIGICSILSLHGRGLPLRPPVQ